MDFFLLKKHVKNLKRRQDLLSFLNHSKDYINCKNAILKNTEDIIEIQSLLGSSKSFFLAQLFKESQKNILLITQNEDHGYNLYQELLHFISKDNLFFYPQRNHFYKWHISPSKTNMHHRLEALFGHLKATQGKEFSFFISSLSNFSQAVIPLQFLKEKIFTLTKNLNYDYKGIRQKLIQYGYQEDSIVNFPGSFAFKESIVDIYTSFHDWPYRIEFFGDKIVSIRQFHPKEQDSFQEVEFCEIFPILELSFDFYSQEFTEDLARQTKNRFEKLLPKDMINPFEERKIFSGIENYSSFFYQNSSLFDYFNPSETLIIFDSFLQTKSAYQKFLLERKEYIQKTSSLTLKDFQFEDWDSIENFFLKLYPQVHIELFKTPDLLKKEKVEAYQFPINIGKNYGGNFNLFKKEILEFIRSGWQIYIVTSNKEKAYSLFNLLKVLEILKDETEFKENENFVYQDRSICIDILYLSQGFQSKDFKFLCILDTEILGKKGNYLHFSQDYNQLGSHKKRSWALFREGEYIVHFKYGIGQYMGLESMVIQNRRQDFLVLKYADNARFLISVQDLPYIQKYIGSNKSQGAPRLDKLSKKSSWLKTKKLVQDRLEEIAKQLFKLYINRLNSKGFSFPKDTLEQFEFESFFEFEETPDQLKAIRDIKEDLENPKAMDRLICGDVGFGKTEVAMRATFKVVSSKKQVALLVPTTVLCEQHFNSFKKRYKNFPEVSIGKLSRLESKKNQKETLEKLASGELDILIGTHRILSKDLHFKDLGLIIIDEEHRFGVKDKERLKDFCLNVEVLSLSATPIPRTMNMAMIKLRDISLIQTPPYNRIPVSTYVLEWDLALIPEILDKELEDQGQVFIIYNHIRTIYDFKRQIQSVLPDTKIAVAYGTMLKEDVQNILSDFKNKRYEILITTTIIESGIDIPDANLILIYNANHFGLTQLYQLRGRVGRSSKKAACYLFYKDAENLTPESEKRLKIIEESSDFGSGYYIAYKDMEIRGVGDVFGYDQSGSISQIGYDLFLRFLFEKMSRYSEKFKDIQYQNLPPVFINLGQEEFIPADYISNQDQRILTYKQIYQIYRLEDIPVFQKNLRDQFGPIPKNLMNLIALIPLRVIARHLGIHAIMGYPDFWTIRWGDLKWDSSCQIHQEAFLNYADSVDFYQDENRLNLKKGFFKETSILSQVDYLKKFLNHCFKKNSLI